MLNVRDERWHLTVRKIRIMLRENNTLYDAVISISRMFCSTELNSVFDVRK